jgi:hypothetical protein
MTILNIISLVFAGIALIAAGISMYYQRKAQKYADEAIRRSAEARAMLREKESCDPP